MEILLTMFIYLKSFFVVALLGISIYFLINIGNSFVKEEKQFKITKKQLYYSIAIIVLILLLYQLYKIASGITSLITPIFISIIFAYLFNPLVNLMEDRGIKRLWGVLLVYLAIIAIVMILSFTIIPKISIEFKKLIDLLPNYFSQLNTYFNEIYNLYSENIENLPPQFQGINDAIRSNLSNIQETLVLTLRNITNTTIGIFSKIFSLILIPILTFYFIKDKEYFKRKIMLTIPKVYRNDIIRVSKEIDIVLSKFIRGQLIVAAFVGITTAIGLLILGIDFALIIGLIAGIANVIPYFGPIIGIVPAVIFALLEKPIKVLWVVILFTLIQQIESNILSPKIVGESVGLHPVVVILVLLIGGSYFGILGMLLAVPAAVILKIVSAFIIEKLTRL
ncbi:AI-2E family transporter [Caldisalinibacter kiritimatiensis]|uniref:Putative permease often clustered with de novo purine synthesis n=1 Tax=Caldisalinibacter kiritimatiensis TaxID=1304284 RepID=R1CCD4_9FIRM|nr:AI-2E family transporter [Caldisalinibacter kiritimatiensis]EOC99954.1 Putative permease often clustered with de novo purine synthesis [Caldisalinibacter kiritimatiensis]